jgi:hypothetical protein
VSEEAAVYMTAPDRNGAPALPKRGGPKGIMPSTWTNRTLRLEYVGGDGLMRESSGTLLDCYPAGAIINIKGAKTCLSWDAVRVVELVED